MLPELVFVDPVVDAVDVSVLLVELAFDESDVDDVDSVDDVVDVDSPFRLSVA